MFWAWEIRNLPRTQLAASAKFRARHQPVREVIAFRVEEQLPESFRRKASSSTLKAITSRTG